MKRLLLTLAGTVVLNLLQVAHAQNVEYVSSTLWTGIRDAEVIGNFAYCVFTSGLGILDISDPANPALIGRKQIAGMGEAIDVEGEYAYFVSHRAGLNIIQVSDPANPILLGTYQISIPIYMTEVSVSGNYAYLACADSGLHIVDISDPEDPQLAGRYDAGRPISRIFVSDGLAYVPASSGTGSDIVNVSDPQNPIPIGNIPVCTSDLCVAGDYAYIAGCNSMVIADVSDPYNAQIASSLTIGNRTRLISVSGDLAFLISGEYGEEVVIVNVSDPYAPYEVRGFYAPAWVFGICASGDFVFLSIQYYGMQIIDVSTPNRPALEGIYVSPTSFANGVFVDGDYAYVSDMSKGLLTVDISDPYNPSPTGQYVRNNSIFYNSFVINGYAYVADYYPGGLEVVDVSAPDNPQFAGRLDGGYSTKNVYVSGDFAYIADLSGLIIADISDPGNPTRVGIYNRSGCNSVIVSGSIAYIAWGTCEDYGCWGGFQVVDVSEPSDPVLIAFYDMADEVSGVYISGNHAYVSATNSGLLIFDITNPGDPYIVGEIETPGQSHDVCISDDFAFVADDQAGLEVIDVSDSYNPEIIANYDILWSVKDVFLADDLIYVTDVSSMTILRFNPPTRIEDAEDLPRRFALNQNYPNPFNSKTKFTFEIPREEDIAVDIFDIMGRHVKTLCEGTRTPGDYDVIWIAEEATSGIYFARVRAGQESKTIKMLYLK